MSTRNRFAPTPPNGYGIHGGPKAPYAGMSPQEAARVILAAERGETPNITAPGPSAPNFTASASKGAPQGPGAGLSPIEAAKRILADEQRDGASALTATEIRIASKMGIPLDKYAAHKARLARIRNGEPG